MNQKTILILDTSKYQYDTVRFESHLSPIAYNALKVKSNEHSVGYLQK